MRQGACILAIDCATGPVSAAVWKNGALAALVEDVRPVVQSARLLPMVEQVLAEAHITYKDLSAVACTVGPGSFTGIRVGLAAAQGICFAAGIPGVGFTTLEVMAYAARENTAPIFAVLNAGKGEWYYQAFSSQAGWKANTPPALGAPDAARHGAPKNAQWIGNIQIDGQDIIASVPRADTLAALAATRSDALPLKPFYIRPPDVTLPKAKA